MIRELRGGKCLHFKNVNKCKHFENVNIWPKMAGKQCLHFEVCKHWIFAHISYITIKLFTRVKKEVSREASCLKKNVMFTFNVMFTKVPAALYIRARKGELG